MITKLLTRYRRHHRLRHRISGTATRPRLSVHISNRHVTAQIIDDSTGQTLAYVTSGRVKGQSAAAGNLTAQAARVGAAVADQAKARKIKQVVLDRGGRRYHGRIHALAEAARQQGLEL